MRPASRSRQTRSATRSTGWAINLETSGWLLAVMLAVLLVPLGMGGFHPLGQAFLTLAAITAAGAWLYRCFHSEQPGWQIGPLELFFAAGLVIGLVQLVPLPASLLGTVSPKLASLLPCWSDGPWTLGRWETLSLTPGETLAGLMIFFTQAVLIGCVLQSVNSVKDVERILLLVATTTGLMAALGVVQYLAGNGKYLWFYESAYNSTSVVTGTFICRNHYASFLSIGAGSLVWWAFAPAAEPAHR
ncbi:MAG: hypothetical protein EBS83_14910, partial [Planctomycetia bacterium]|nr:hypothetical protein [Planctomycetia bacterium]